MPVEENGTLGGTSTTPSNTNPPVGAISDLGDILLDKSLDSMQKNDFVAVTKNDVAGLNTDDDEDNDPFAKPTSTQDSTPLPAVENHATIEDLQNIMLDSPTSESPFVDQNKEDAPLDTPIAVGQNTEANALQIDLGDIGGTQPTEAATTETPVVAEEVVSQETVEPVVDSDPLAIDLGDVSTQPTEATTTETPVVVEEVVSQETVEPVVDSDPLAIDLGDVSTQSTEAATTETPVVVEEVVSPMSDDLTTFTENVEGLSEEIPPATENNEVISDNVTPSIETPETSQENTTDEISIDTSGLESSTIPEGVIVEDVLSQDIPLEATINATPSITPEIPTPAVVTENSTNNTPEVSSFDAPHVETTQPETNTQPSNNPDAIALEKVAEEVTQGIDLDSLMVETPKIVSPTQVADEATAKQTPKEGLKAMFDGSNGNQKKLLFGLGAFVLIGVLYFGYLVVVDSLPSTPTPQVTAPVEQNTGATTSNENSSGDIVIDEVATGSADIVSGDVVDGEVNTGEITADTTTSIDTGSIEPIAKTPAEILSSAKDLGGQVRKALIKATIAKNAQMRLSAFGLQKDVETFVQSLENTNDMTTVSDSETKLNSLSQRLDSILQKLDGSSQ